MSRVVLKLVVLVTVVMVLFSASNVRAADQTATISRGQTGIWWVDEGQTLTVTYTSNGGSTTFTWWDNRVHYFAVYSRTSPRRGPLTAMIAYSILPTTCQLFFRGSADVFPQSRTLILPKGTQCVFVFRNSFAGDLVYLQAK